MTPERIVWAVLVIVSVLVNVPAAVPVLVRVIGPARVRLLLLPEVGVRAPLDGVGVKPLWPTWPPLASSRAVIVLLPARISLPVSLTMSPEPATARVPT